MSRQERQHDRRILRALRPVYSGGIGQRQFVGLGPIVSHRPPVEVYHQRLHLEVHVHHPAQVALAHLAVAVVARLHHPVAHAEAAADDGPFGFVRCGRIESRL